MNLLREYIRNILQEGNAGPGKRFIYRGMKIDVGDRSLASTLRKIAKGQKTGLSEAEAGRIVLGFLKDGEIGESWTTEMSVASNFADVWEAKNRGTVMHFMFTAIVPDDFGYDPQAAEEEPGMFSDEREVRIPKGEEIEILSIGAYIANPKARGPNWSRFRDIAFRPGTVKA